MTYRDQPITKLISAAAVAAVIAIAAVVGFQFTNLSDNVNDSPSTSAPSEPSATASHPATSAAPHASEPKALWNPMSSPSPPTAEPGLIATFTIASGAGGFQGLVVMDPDTGVESWQAAACGGPLAWSPDGSLLAATCADGVTVFNVDGTPGYTIPDVAMAAWAPGSATLVVARSNGLAVVSAVDGEISPIGPVWVMRDVAWRADGGAIAFTSFGPDVAPGAPLVGDEPVAVYTIVPDGTVTQLTYGSIDHGLHYSPDGSQLAFLSTDPISSATTAHLAASGELRDLGQVRWGSANPWSADGTRLLVVANGGEELSTLVLDGEVLAPIAVASEVWAPVGGVWSPDGESVLIQWFAKMGDAGRLERVALDGDTLIDLGSGYDASWQSAPAD